MQKHLSAVLIALATICAPGVVRADEPPTPPGRVPCSAEDFEPIPVQFLPVDTVDGAGAPLSLSVDYAPGHEQPVRFTFWGRQTECSERVHKLAYFGEFETPFLATTEEDGSVTFHIRGGEALVYVGTSRDAHPFCGDGSCRFSMVRTSASSLEYRFAASEIAIREVLRLPRSPRLVPVVG